MGFNTFLPPGYKIEVQMNDVSSIIYIPIIILLFAELLFLASNMSTFFILDVSWIHAHRYKLQSHHYKHDRPAKPALNHFGSTASSTKHASPINSNTHFPPRVTPHFHFVQSFFGPTLL